MGVRRGLVLVAVLLLVPSVGCLGGDDAGGDAQEGTSETPANTSTRIHAPNWSIGDYWTYTTNDGEEQTWAITGEAGEDWILDTDSREGAFFDARFDVSFFGERRKSDLAGSQGDTRVEFFDWPLEEGKTWTTTWDGFEREITVESIEDGTAHLLARQDGRVAVDYTYDSEAGHFGSYTFLDENGTEVFGADLQTSGLDYQGTLVRWELTTGVEEAGTFGLQPASFGFGFEVPENATDLWLSLSVGCPGNGAYDFGFGPSGDAQTDQGSGYSNEGSCPAEVDVMGPIVEEPSPGEYRGGFTASSPEAEGNYDILLYVRSLQEIAVGQG